MRPKQLLVFVTFGIIAVGDLHAGLIIFTDVVPFQAAAGNLIEIDFETLPDGSPSVFGVNITPEFNYTNYGVDFFPSVPELFITGNSISGFGLTAGQRGSGGPRNWLIAELVTPAMAVGVLFPGGTTISIFDVNGMLIFEENFRAGGLSPFGGFISSVPIGSVIVDRGIEVESIESFLFTPVPEPATLLLLAVGSLFVLRRKRY